MDQILKDSLPLYPQCVGRGVRGLEGRPAEMDSRGCRVYLCSTGRAEFTQD